VTVSCEHGAQCHDGTTSAMASAPEASRAWLLVEHPGPWPAEATGAELPGRLSAAVAAADALGVRVQLIRRPGRREPWTPERPRTIYVGWTASDPPWLRRGVISEAPGSRTEPEISLEHGLDALASGRQPMFGVPVSEPVFLVCVHGRRDVCCARFGVPLAQSLAASYPGQVWETTHVGGHRYAANLVLLPHGLYYGPVGTEEATRAIDAYTQGTIVAERYRGRAGQPHDVQAAEHTQLTAAGSLTVSALN
jgi:hypothetical protein